MSLLPDLNTAVDASSGLFLLGLAALVAWVSPKPLRGANRLLVLFSGAMGVFYFVANLPGDGASVQLDPLAPYFHAAALPFAALAAGAIAVLPWTFPARLAPSERKLVLLAFALPVAGALGTLAFQDDPTRLVVPVFRIGTWVLILPALQGALLLLGLRALHAGRPGTSPPRSYNLLTASLLTYPGIVAGFMVFAGSPSPAATAVGLLVLGVIAVLWLRIASRNAGPASRAARNVGLLALVLPLLGMLVGTAEFVPGLFGATRILTVLVLAYAILRHQLLGMDIKVQWTIKQSTVAAAFIGVFFVVSESASTFLSSSGLGPYLGIAAAGMLVFAMAPLQRAAERVASAAMPGVKATTDMSGGERAAAYRELARSAWADGSLSGDERRMLKVVRAQLGLSPEEAERLEEEVAPA